jgi:hypothetical protein
VKERRIIGGPLHVYLLHFENTMKKIRNTAGRCMSIICELWKNCYRV